MWMLSILVIGTILFVIALCFIIKGVKAVWEPFFSGLPAFFGPIVAAVKAGWKRVKTYLGGVWLMLVKRFSHGAQPVAGDGHRQKAPDEEVTAVR